MLTCQISSRSVNSVALGWWKTPNFAIFWIWHFVMLPVGGIWRKLIVVAQLQIFPYPTVSKSFLDSNGFMAKLCAQSLSFKSMTDTQTSTQTKNSMFWLSQQWVISEPHRTWHSDRGPWARSCVSKTFGGSTYTFTTRGHWKFWEILSPSIKTPITL